MDLAKIVETLFAFGFLSDGVFLIIKKKIMSREVYGQTDS